jgi:hypothetical protein
MYTNDLVKAVTRLSDADIRYAMTVCLNQTSQGPYTGGELLPLLVYDLLKSLGFTVEHVTAIVIQTRDQLKTLGNSYENAKPGDQFTLSVLEILDNRYMTISDREGVKEGFDFTRMESVQRIPKPVLSLALSLPGLYERALATALSGQS